YQTAAAALVFMQWYTQAKAEDGGYILTDWCQAGHIPAWKNVYDSADFQAAKEKSLTLKALGDPAQVMALEGLEYASTLFNGVANSCTAAIQAMESDAGCTVEQAIQIIKNTAGSTQTTLDLLKLGF
ncbi:MAG: hypothetical protein IJF71_08000, partial [Clostridia bacterium]|nr:hypothetical protein [Clostridia bacterium]